MVVLVLVSVGAGGAGSRFRESAEPPRLQATNAAAQHGSAATWETNATGGGGHQRRLGGSWGCVGCLAQNPASSRACGSCHLALYTNPRFSYACQLSLVVHSIPTLYGWRGWVSRS